MDRPDTQGLTGLWAADFVRQAAPEVDWLVTGLMVRGGTTELYGRTGTGKTWLALQLIAHLMSGTPFLGRFGVPDPTHVVYVQAELDDSQLRFRLHTLAQTYPILNESGPWLPAPQVQRIARADRWRPIVEAVDRLDAGLLVLDPLRQMAASGDMNNEASMSDLLDRLNDLRFSRKTHVMVVHHARKSRVDAEGERLDGGYEESGGNRAVIEWAEAILRIQGDPIDRPSGKQQLVIEKLRGAPRHQDRMELTFDRQRLIFVPKRTASLQTALELLGAGLGVSDWRDHLEATLSLSRSSAYRLIHEAEEAHLVHIVDGRALPEGVDTPAAGAVG